ncbi:MAG: arsenate reductase family protein [Asticcacaulis sp.]|uniref:arsenate reductase family protein n=1 Tax=Asticcacaulis sp. TaxID=1872648 RepID=UPI0039E3752D
MPPIIFHNPDCGTSRNVLAVLEAAGYQPEVVEYLTVGWTRELLLTLLTASGLTPRQALRESKSPAKALGLLEADVSDEMIFAAMLETPVLVNRPFVVTDRGVKLCRPSEIVFDLIDRYPPGPFAREDGQLMIDAEGRRVTSGS